MIKKLVALLCFFIMISIFDVQALAAENLSVYVNVNGKIDKGETIQIQINLKNISSFYAGSIDFKYDPSVLKIKSIEKGDLINQKDANGKNISTFEVPDKDLGDGIASYGFSCLGKINGFSGSGTFVIINGEIVNKSSFHLKSQPFLKEPSDDFNVKLQVVDTNLNELSYTFNPYVYDAAGNIIITPSPSSSAVPEESAAVTAANSSVSATADGTATPTEDNSDSSKKDTGSPSGTAQQPPVTSDSAVSSTPVKKKDIIENIVNFVNGSGDTSDTKDNNAAVETNNVSYKVSKTILISTGGVFILGLFGVLLFKKFRK